MGRAEREVSEERPIRPHTLAVVDHPQQLVDEVLGDVVPLLGSRRRVDVGVVTDELGMELVGLPLQEPVVPVEAPSQRPLVERSGRGDVLGRGCLLYTSDAADE